MSKADKARDELYELQCKICGYDIEMASVILLENRKVSNEVVHLTCFLDNLSKVAAERELEEY